MDILIGKQGNQPFPLSESSISRQHAVLHVDSNTGMMTLRDNNSTNGTWIKAKDGTFKRISGQVNVRPENTIRLGAQFICTVQQLIKKPEEPAVDISDLRYCYDNYVENKMAIEAKSSNIMMLRMASMSLGTIFGLVIAVILPAELVGNQTIGMIVKVLSTLLSIGLAYCIVDKKNKDLIRSKRQNEETFKSSYCCPKCGYHFGMKVYSNLLAEGKCPNNSCKCKFKES